MYVCIYIRMCVCVCVCVCVCIHTHMPTYIHKVLGRVDAYQRAAEFGYVDLSRDRNKGVPALARGVLSLDYEPPKQVSLGNWESETLTSLQLSCAALDAWVPLQALILKSQKRPTISAKETCYQVLSCHARPWILGCPSRHAFSTVKRDLL